MIDKTGTSVEFTTIPHSKFPERMDCHCIRLKIADMDVDEILLQTTFLCD